MTSISKNEDSNRRTNPGVRRSTAIVVFVLVGFLVGMQGAENIAICIAGISKVETVERFFQGDRTPAGDWKKDSSAQAKETPYIRTMEQGLVDYKEYKPAPVEAYVIDNVEKLGYTSETNPPGCNIWKNSDLTPYYDALQTFRAELANYSSAVAAFPEIKQDLRWTMARRGPEAREEICQGLELHPQGIEGFFSSSRQLSMTKSGFAEPILTPMRSPDICFRGGALMKMNYIVHDFAAMCRKLKSSSRTVFIDMGAALDFHGAMDSPAVYISKLYGKFGFKFDHIYAYEIKPKDPNNVYDRVPDELLHAYHWINVGVSGEVGNRRNPLSTILKSFTPDDFIVVKLDIDHSPTEIPLAYQVMNDSSVHEMIDQFYFEHHVHLGELARWWTKSMGGSVAQSLELFHKLRQLGVAAHFWP